MGNAKSSWGIDSMGLVNTERSGQSPPGNRDMLCLAVVGLPGAGKSEFLKVAAGRGFACLEWSSILALDLEPQPKRDRQMMHEAAERLVESRGVSHYPRKIFDALNASPGLGHVVGGARNPRELECLRSYYSLFRVVWISSHYLARFMRCAERGRTDRSENLEEFVRQDMYEFAHGLAEIACSLTDDVLFNDADLETYRQAVLTYLNRFPSKGGLYEQPRSI